MAQPQVGYHGGRDHGPIDDDGRRPLRTPLAAITDGDRLESHSVFVILAEMMPSTIMKRLGESEPTRPDLRLDSEMAARDGFKALGERN